MLVARKIFFDTPWCVWGAPWLSSHPLRMRGYRVHIPSEEPQGRVCSILRSVTYASGRRLWRQDLVQDLAGWLQGRVWVCPVGWSERECVCECRKISTKVELYLEMWKKMGESNASWLEWRHQEGEREGKVTHCTFASSTPISACVSGGSSGGASLILWNSAIFTSSLIS